jgi:hypothetical protein
MVEKEFPNYTNTKKNKGETRRAPFPTLFATAAAKLRCHGIRFQCRKQQIDVGNGLPAGLLIERLWVRFANVREAMHSREASECMGVSDEKKVMQDEDGL